MNSDMNFSSEPTEATQTSRSAAVTSAWTGSTAAPLTVTLGLAAASWVVAIRRMCAIAVVAVAQKLLPAKAAIDVPLALAIIGLGLLIVTAPSSVPGLMPPM